MAAVAAAARATCTETQAPAGTLPGRKAARRMPSSDRPYLRSYPEPLQEQARELLAQGRLGAVLARKYPQAHAVRTDKALYQYAMDLKSQHLRNADAVNKVVFDNKIHVVRHALGLHSTVARVQGRKLAARHEIRIAALFKQAPEEFLRMIVVHELAHLREREHDKAFYQLCQHMEPHYHQYELDVRLYLTHMESSGERLWDA